MVDVLEIDEADHELRFYLADWYVDSSANRLCRGVIEAKLESKVMAVLTYLARHPGELVAREDLERAIWGKTVVGYDALTRCIAKLRKVFGDDPRNPRYIETVSKKGYRLIAQVSGADHHLRSSKEAVAVVGAHLDSLPHGLTGRIFWAMGAVVALGLIVVGILWFVPIGGEDTASHTHRLSDPSIAVLPFTNLSDDPSQRYFSDGITADLTTALSKFSGLFVISQSSAIGYRDTPLEATQVARSLGVRYLLQGSIRRAGDRLRLNVHLVDATNDFYLWSERYERELRDVFAVQDDITAHIIEALAVKLTEEEKRRAARRYTASLDAYDDFLRAQALYFRHNQEDNRLARDHYRQAIDRDPYFARAYGAMALTYVAEYRHVWGETSSGPLEQALRLAKKGITLDRSLPQLHWVLGYVHLFRQEYAEALRPHSAR